jgi:hypothetical protein
MVNEIISVFLGTRQLYLKIVSNLSNLFEDPDSVLDTGHALVLLLNTYKRFQDGNLNVFYSFRNLSVVFKNRIKY